MFIIFIIRINTMASTHVNDEHVTCNINTIILCNNIEHNVIRLHNQSQYYYEYCVYSNISEYVHASPEKETIAPNGYSYINVLFINKNNSNIEILQQPNIKITISRINKKYSVDMYIKCVFDEYLCKSDTYCCFKKGVLCSNVHIPFITEYLKSKYIKNNYNKCDYIYEWLDTQCTKAQMHSATHIIFSDCSGSEQCEYDSQSINI